MLEPDCPQCMFGAPDGATISERVMQMVDEFVMTTVAQLCKLEAAHPELARRQSYLYGREQVFGQIEALEEVSCRLRAQLAGEARFALPGSDPSRDARPG